ncbi:MAG: aminopeptidase P family protein [Bacteroidales bacterium]|nr:aminopeptidase P family protein [Bacteroidales bacterium]
MKALKLQILLFALSLILCNTQLFSQSTEEFKHRRQEVISKLEPNSVLILRSGNVSGTFAFPRIGGFFYYLTGINETNASLVLRGEHTRPLPPARFGVKPQAPPSEVLFVTPHNPVTADWDAQGFGIEGAKEELGFMHVKPSGEFDDYLGEILLSSPEVLYFDYDKSKYLDSPLTEDEQRINKAREKGAVLDIQSPALVIAPFLRTKSPAEIDILQTSVNIASEAHRTAMKSIQPGMYEYQLQAIIRYVYSINGAPAAGFPCIIGSGPNSVILHWMENSRKMEDGDIVVVDIGADYQFYWSDITRTIPVNGKYSPRQKEIYEIVLNANEEAIKMVKPGVPFSEVSKKADEVLAEGMLKIGLIDDKKDFKKYYFHGLGHHIGLINARGVELGTLEAGMVITIEPGIYIREEELGVRIEDDVLVTDTGHRVLSASVPKKVDEIEKLMSEKGIDISDHLIRQTQ